MKSVRNVLALFTVLSLSIGFWLLPNINKGAERKYVRYYEDTDGPPVLRTSFVAAADTTQKRKPKKYKKQIIEPKRERRIDAKVFSRAIQFEPLVEVDTLMPEIAKEDSLSVVQ